MLTLFSRTALARLYKYGYIKHKVYSSSYFLKLLKRDKKHINHHFFIINHLLKTMILTFKTQKKK